MGSGRGHLYGKRVNQDPQSEFDTIAASRTGGQSMKQVKSVLAGIAATVLIVGAVPLVADFIHLLFFFVRGLRAGGFGIAFGPVRWHVPTLNEWLFILARSGWATSGNFAAWNGARSLILAIHPINRVDRLFSRLFVRASPLELLRSDQYRLWR
jgi:hypothetical protein